MKKIAEEGRFWEGAMTEQAIREVKEEATSGEGATSLADAAKPQRRRGRRKRRTRARARTISIRRLSKAELNRGRLLYPETDYWRPTTRAECKDMERPCPYVSCKYHLYIDVHPVRGSIKLNFPDLEVWEMTETCALDVADRARKLALEVLDLAGAAQALGARAVVLRARGELRAAREHEEAALALWERPGDPQWGAKTRLELGRIQLASGELTEAESNLSLAAQTFKTLGDRSSQAEVGLTLAQAFLLRGELSRTRDSLERAQEDAEAGGAGRSVLRIRAQLARLSLVQGDLARAQKTFRALLLQKLDESAGITKADVYFYLGDISHQQGDARKAKALLERALPIEEAAYGADHPEVATTLNNLAIACRRLGDAAPRGATRIAAGHRPAPGNRARQRRWLQHRQCPADHRRGGHHRADHQLGPDSGPRGAGDNLLRPLRTA